ncbi:MAG: acyl-CoA thioesterase domain-containing protein [Caulobacterales bacterium]
MDQTEPPFQRDSDALNLPAQLMLDQIGPNRFRNRYNQPNMFRAIFGGSTIAQALAAADRTVEGRAAHSLHAYFLRPGVADVPVEFEVERVRDGGRFSSRRVVAIQSGAVILSAECSYKTPIEGFRHQQASKVAFDPERALDPTTLIDPDPEKVPPHLKTFQRRFAVDVRLSGERGFSTKGDAERHYWLRAASAAGHDDPALQRQILTFMSDFMFAGVPLSPHTIALAGPHIFIASLDHAIWFHRPARCDDWLLFETESPNAEGGVNLTLGRVYNRAGELVASVAQEALQFPLTPKPPAA